MPCEQSLRMKPNPVDRLAHESLAPSLICFTSGGKKGAECCGVRDCATVFCLN